MARRHYFLDSYPPFVAVNIEKRTKKQLNWYTDRQDASKFKVYLIGYCKCIHMPKTKQTPWQS